MKGSYWFAALLLLAVCTSPAHAEGATQITVRREGAPVEVEVDGETRLVERRVYDVAPLVESLGARGGEAGAGEIAVLLVEAVAGEAEADDETGYVRPEEGEVAVLATAAVQDEVLALLESLLAPRLDAGLEVPPGAARIEAAFAKRVNCEFKSAPVSKVARFLGEAVGVPVRIAPSIGEGDYRVDLSLEDVRAQDILRYLVYAAGGEVEVDAESVWITHRPPVFPRVYEMRDLLRRNREPNDPRSGDEILEIAIASLPAVWDLDERRRVLRWGEMLVAVLPRSGHRRIETVLAALRGAGSHTGGLLVTRLDEQHPTTSERLEQRVSLDLDTPTLSEALAALRTQSGLNIAIAPASLGFDDVAHWLPRIREVRAADMLDLLCEYFVADWGIRGGLVIVAESGRATGTRSADALPERTSTAVYDVSSLVDSAVGQEAKEGIAVQELRQIYLQEFSDLVTSCFEYEMGDQDPILIPYDGTLLLIAADKFHASLDRLLGALRARGGPGPEKPAWVREIETRLETRGPLTVEDEYYEDALAQFGDKLGVNLLLGPDLGIERDVITLDLPEGETAWDLLRGTAEHCGAHAVLRNGVLMFASSRPLETRVYDVRDLVGRMDPAMGSPNDPMEAFRRLEDLAIGIREEFLAEWADEGRNLVIHWDDMLVVRESADTHARIAQRIENLRFARR